MIFRLITESETVVNKKVTSHREGESHKAPLVTSDLRFSEHINCLSLIFNIESDTILEDFLELKDFKRTMKLPITRIGNESFTEITNKLNRTVTFVPQRYPSMPVFAKLYGSRSGQ